MSKATLLSKLKLTATPIRTNISPTIKKRNNLITKLKEQLKSKSLVNHTFQL